MKRTLSLLLVLVMVISMVPNVFATTDNSDVDFSDLFYEKLDTYSPLVADIKANNVVGFVWTATGEGTLTYEVPENYTMTLTQNEQTVSGTGTVTMEVVADEKVYIEVVNNTAEDVEGLTIEGTFGTAACDHVAGEAVEEDRVEATCKEPGSYNSVVYCSVCGEKLSSTAVEIPVIAHTPGEAVEEDRVEATCTAVGSYNSVVYCSVCGDKLSSTAVEIPKAEHTWDEGVKYPATTERNAYTLYTCTVCGATKEVEEEGTQLPPEPAFAITTQPTDQHNKLKDKVTFTVVATGAVSYQWQRIKKGATKWSDISGATGSSYSFTVSTDKVLPYRCVLKDAAGNELITDEVTIILPDPIVHITNTPDVPLMVKNTRIYMTVELDSTEGVTYQWQRCKNGTNWTNVSYHGNQTNTLDFEVSPWNQYPYRCEITDANGTKIYTESYTFELYESPIPFTFISNAKDLYAHIGDTITFSLEAQGSSFVHDGSENTGVTYQWWRNKNPEVNPDNWNKYTGAGGTGKDFTVKVSNDNKGYWYMCEVKDGYGNTLKSRVVKALVVEPVKITAQPTVSVEEVDGVKTATFSFEATGDVRTYQWERLKGTGWVDANNATSYVGNNTTTMSTTVTGTFRCRITDMAGTVTYTDEITFTK